MSDQPPLCSRKYPHGPHAIDVYHGAKWVRQDVCPGVTDPDEPRRCPDDGACWHNCGAGPCWRVNNAGPLGYAHYPNDEWPDAIKAAHAPTTVPMRVRPDSMLGKLRAAEAEVKRLRAELRVAAVTIAALRRHLDPVDITVGQVELADPPALSTRDALALADDHSSDPSA